MTREEAIAKFIDAANPESSRTAAWIDRFVALGMLKLDDPEIIYSGPALGAIDAVIGNKFTSAVHVARALDAAGFKIVRKHP